jgi:uncharacterized protein YoxC
VPLLDTHAIYLELVPIFGEAAANALTGVLGRIVADLAQTVTKEEFAELKAVVQQLAIQVEALAEAQRALAQAQKRTEQRVEQLAARMDELAEAQKRTEQRVEQLARRMDELAEAQRALAQAQKRTEEEVHSLAVALKETRKMVGGLSDAVGYTLEDRAIRSLPGLLPELAGLSPEGPFTRRWVRDREGELVELNILGYARRGSGEVVTLVGEAKARARVKDVDNLRRLLAQLAGSEVVRGELVGVLVAYQVRPEVEEKARQAGVLLVPSYLLAL